jgi:hypothetical protein
MNDPDYTITVKLNKVTEGDVADIAQAIYDSYSHECDVDLAEQLVASHAALTLREEMLGKTRRRYGQTIRDLDREVEQRQERLNELARGELEVGPETDEWRQP